MTSHAPRVSALVVSFALHAAVLAAGALIRVGVDEPAERPASSWSYEARLVERPRAEDEVVARPPRSDVRDALPPPRDEEVVAPAIDWDLANDEAPPAAAPSIAVSGGDAGRARPREWSDRPSVCVARVAGKGRGSRHAGGRGAARPSAPPVVVAARVAPPVAAEPSPPPPPVRVAARLLAFEAPAYPEEARDRGLEGAVRLEVDVLADGTAGDVRLVESSGRRLFDEAAAACVKRWRFAPATVDGRPVVATLALPPIRFRME